jgi:hypothetical protein
MASRAKKPAPGDFGLLPLLPPEGPELDALIKAKVAEADADPRPYVPIKKAFKRIRANIAGNG